MALEGVSFVIPVHDGERYLEAVLAAVLAQDVLAQDGAHPIEVIAVDDASSDRSGAILERFAAQTDFRVLRGEGRGAAAALNLGVKAARHPLIAQVDQDVVLRPGWLARLVEALDDDNVAAAQGHYLAAPGASIWARIMALDLAQRYRRMGDLTEQVSTNHVCTGNTLYRADALKKVGLFNESLGYGYDNDLSYRLGDAGFRLVLCPQATSIHHWRENAQGYLRQQYGQGYGRLDLVARYPGRIGGDDVSSFSMMLHAPAMALVVTGLASTPLVAALGGPWTTVCGGVLALLAVLGIERLVAGIRSWTTSGDPASLALPAAHLLRDLAWTAAIASWCVRRLLRRTPSSRHSMPR